MHQPYIPISCTVHDQLLEIATFRQECVMTVSSPDGRARQVRGTIVDVYSRQGAEYLQLHDGTTYRLDQIETLNGEPIAP